mgnify:CR=1 FL=1
MSARSPQLCHLAAAAAMSPSKNTLTMQNYCEAKQAKKRTASTIMTARQDEIRTYSARTHILKVVKWGYNIVKWTYSGVYLSQTM